MVFYDKIAKISTYNRAKDFIQIQPKTGLKNGESGGQVTVNRKATIFCQVWHQYKLLHA